MDESLVLHIRARHRRLTCPNCGCWRPGTARCSTRVRNWRHLGIWGRDVWIRGHVRRFHCLTCRTPVTEAVPWARHESRFTRPFEDAVGLMAQRTDQTAVSQLFGIAWQTVGNIAERLVDELLDPERFASLRRIGVDEISFRKHHRYITIVTDHDTGNVIWADEGKCSETLKRFFKGLPPEVCEAIEIVTMDMSQAYMKAVRETLPNAMIAFDHFHIAKLANDALAEVRRGLQRELRASQPELAQEIKGKRWALAYSLMNLPRKHLAALTSLKPRSPLARAYLLEEDLLWTLKGVYGNVKDSLAAWLAWACRSRLEPFVRLGRTIRSHLPGIHAFIDNQITNARAEGINNKVRLLSHRAFGFHSAESLIATVYLCCGGVRIPGSLQLL
ncbi:MAG: ISL3 family transposase [Planctomycetota bacterium]